MCVCGVFLSPIRSVRSASSKWKYALDQKCHIALSNDIRHCSADTKACDGTDANTIHPDCERILAVLFVRSFCCGASSAKRKKLIITFERFDPIGSQILGVAEMWINYLCGMRAMWRSWRPGWTSSAQSNITLFICRLAPFSFPRTHTHKHGSIKRRLCWQPSQQIMHGHTYCLGFAFIVE